MAERVSAAAPQCRRYDMCDVSETDSLSYMFILRVKINKNKKLNLSTCKSECFLILKM